jgi:hypothetical protein
MTKSDRTPAKRRALRPLKVTSNGTPDPSVIAMLLVSFFGREFHEKVSKLPIDLKSSDR